MERLADAPSVLGDDGSTHYVMYRKDRFDQADQPGMKFNDDIPSPQKHTVSFMWKLMKAWVAMGLKAPEIDYIKGNISS